MLLNRKEQDVFFDKREIIITGLFFITYKCIACEYIP